MEKERYIILQKGSKFNIKKEIKIFNLFKISYFLRDTKYLNEVIWSFVLLQLQIPYWLYNDVTSLWIEILISVMILFLPVIPFLNREDGDKILPKLKYSFYHYAKEYITEIYDYKKRKELDKEFLEREKIRQKEEKKSKKELSKKQKYKIKGIISENKTIENDDLKKYLKKENRKEILNKLI